MIPKERSMRPIETIKALGLLLILFSLSACAEPYVTGQTSSFGTLERSSGSQPYFISTNGERVRSPEFKQYAASIARRLSAHDWDRVGSINEAKYIVLIDYGIRGYERYFEMDVIDASSNSVVYETKVASFGRSGVFGVVSECIFDFALENFPEEGSVNHAGLMEACGQ